MILMMKRYGCYVVLLTVMCYIILTQLICALFIGKDEKFDFKKIVSDNWIEPPKRERKRKYVSLISGITLSSFNLLSLRMIYYSFFCIFSYSESEYFKQTMRQSGPARPKEPRIPRMPQL